MTAVESPETKDEIDVDNLIAAIEHQGGRCRDCADAFGICDNGLPCDRAKKREAVLTILGRIEYYREHVELYRGMTAHPVSVNPSMPEFLGVPEEVRELLAEAERTARANGGMIATGRLWNRARAVLIRLTTPSASPEPIDGVAADPVKRWPFAESPGDFADRLHALLPAPYLKREETLAAVRTVLIEEPPRLAAWLEPGAAAADSAELSLLKIALRHEFVGYDLTTPEGVRDYAQKLTARFAELIAPPTIRNESTSRVEYEPDTRTLIVHPASENVKALAYSNIAKALRESLNIPETTPVTSDLIREEIDRLRFCEYVSSTLSDVAAKQKLRAVDEAVATLAHVSTLKRDVIGKPLADKIDAVRSILRGEFADRLVPAEVGRHLRDVLFAINKMYWESPDARVDISVMGPVKLAIAKWDAAEKAAIFEPKPLTPDRFRVLNTHDLEDLAKRLRDYNEPLWRNVLADIVDAVARGES